MKKAINDNKFFHKRGLTGYLLLFMAVSTLLFGCGQAKDNSIPTSESTGTWEEINAVQREVKESVSRNAVKVSDTVVQDPALEGVFTETYQRIAEPFGKGFILNGTAHQVMTGGHTYLFDAPLPEAQCREMIAVQEELCAWLAERGILTEDVSFYAIEGYPNRSESEEKLAYINPESVRTWEQILTTLQVSMGDYTNYGYLYALSDFIAADLGWKREERVDITIDTAADHVLVETPELLNLVYPCFDTVYTSEEDIAFCKVLAGKVFMQMEDPFAGEAAFVRAQENYAEANDIDFTPTYLTFAYNSESCPLKFRTRYLEIFRDNTFVTYVTYADGTKEEQYPALADVYMMVHSFEWLDTQLEKLQEKFETETQELVPVQLTRRLPDELPIPAKVGGCYINTIQKIYATSVTVLGHEYIHHLLNIKLPGQYTKETMWCNEVLAHYYTLDCEFERTKHQAETGCGLSEEQLADMIGHEYNTPYDEILRVREWMLRRNPTKYTYLDGLKVSNKLCSAFGEYFIRIYGEPVFMNCMFHPERIKELTGRTLDQVVDDWYIDMTEVELEPEPPEYLESLFY